MHATTLTVITALLLSGPIEGDAPPSNVAEIQLSQVFLIDDVMAPAQEAGLLLSVEVKEGDTVEAGRLLAQIDDRQAVLERDAALREREAALARANDDIDVQYAIKSFELADEELRNSNSINQGAGGTVARSEIRRMELARHRAKLQIGKSKLDMRVARLNAEVHQGAVEGAEEKIRRRRIVAPFDGMVLEVQRRRGEWVDRGEPLVRVARMDRLRVDGFISASEYDPHEIADKAVTVEVELARGRKARLPGRIVYVNPLIQAGNRYRVRAEVRNRKENGQWVLQSGKSARTFVHLDSR